MSKNDNVMVGFVCFVVIMLGSVKIDVDIIVFIFKVKKLCIWSVCFKWLFLFW